MIIKKAFFSISFFTFISRVLGFIRDLLLASFIGVGITSDAFLVAFKLPNFFRRIFAEGAFNAAFIPIFSEILKVDGQRKAIIFAERILSLLLLVTIIFVILAQVFMPSIILIFAPGYLPGGEQSELTIKLSRLTFPYLILISLVTLFSGVINSLGKFASVAFTPIILNVVLIFGISLTNYFNKNSGEVIAIAVTLAGIFQLLWLFFPLHKLNIRIFLTLPSYSKKHIEFFKLFLPGVIGASVVQINLLTDIIFASLLPKGSISFLYFADRVNQLPLGIIGVALSTALLPILSQKIITNKEKEAVNLQNRAIEIGLFFGIPAMFSFIFFSQEIIRPLFERGAFLPSDTDQSTLALKMYLLGLPFYGCYKVFAPTFYTLDKPKIPVLISMFCIGLNVIFCLALVDRFGFSILALGTSLSMCVNVLCQSVLLKRLLNLPLGFFFSLRVLKMVLAGVIAYLAVDWVVRDFFDYSLPFLWKIFYFCLIGIFGFLAYTLSLLSMGEYSELKKFTSKRVL